MRISLLLASGAAGFVIDRWTRRTRASRSEKTVSLPGDDLVPVPDWRATRAVTIAAPPAAVWPWLVQMGYPAHRAGWYIPLWIDRVVFGVRTPSAERIIPELQDLRPGDRVPDSPDGIAAYFTAAEVRRDKALVLFSRTHPLPLYRDVSFSWAFVLNDGRDPGTTRLLMRARTSFTPVGPPRTVRRLVRLLFGVGDVVQAGAMLAGIKARVEMSDGERAEHPPDRLPHDPVAAV